MKSRTIAAMAILAALAAVVPAAATRGDDKDRKSKNGKAEGTAGGAKIAVEYGRPNVSQRAIWGQLVPYGQVWRAGADEATTVTFDRDVLVEGKALAAGRYAFFAIPTATKWTVIFNKTADQWGAFKYDEKQDALRVVVTPRAHAAVETLEYAVDGNGLTLRWEKLEVPVGIRAAKP